MSNFKYHCCIASSVHPSLCFRTLITSVPLLFLPVPDPHEDDASSHVPSADSTGATCLHLNTHTPLTQSHPHTPRSPSIPQLFLTPPSSSCPVSYHLTCLNLYSALSCKHVHLQYDSRQIISLGQNRVLT